MKLPFKSPFKPKAPQDAPAPEAADENIASENLNPENLNPETLNLEKLMSESLTPENAIVPASSAIEPSGALALQSAKPVSKFSVVKASGQVGSAIGNLITKNLFFTLIVVSAGAHTAFLLLAPNPLKKLEKPHEIDVVSTIPVVKLPAKTSAPTVSKSDFKLPFNPFAAKPSIPTPSPFSSDPSTILSTVPYQDPFPFTLSTPPLSSPDVLPPTPRNEVKVPQRTFSAVPPEDNSDVIDNTKPVKPPQSVSNLKPGLGGKDNVVDPDGQVKPTKPGTGQNNLDGSGSNVKEGVLSDTTLYGVVDKYRANLIFTEIAPDSTNIPIAKVEKGVKWIAPKAFDLNGKKGSVEVALIVAPSGKVELALFPAKGSGVPEFDKIVRETVTGYYDKFQPMQEEQHKGKYRYVTIKYTFPTS
jgi:hypothetical protein